ncbi:chaperonin 10-like protein [Massariosphaeria phaeospora]|uniref:Chaperonin 10-like protein n=1 Tax=Massariosphaeria phaeospora TaxID=100035 RepID=A0A7C8HZF5_9PLEO|nr:chaperonin 10-like protein [Massariosphaeria phaeospora]
MATEQTPDPKSSAIQIRASVLHGAKDLRIESRTLAPPSPSDLQIAIRDTGLCGSDLHYYRHYRNGDIQVLAPLSLGHESVGVVVALGASVTGFHVGDHVALEVGLPCGACARCEEGRYNICKGMQFRSSAKAVPHVQGTLQERINHPARWCYRLPPSVPLSLGALLEPLSVAIQASKRAQLAPHSTVLVFGAGAVGLLVAAMAKISGAATVVIADIDAGRVAFAVQNKFAHSKFTVPLKRGDTIEQCLEIAKETAAQIARLEGRDGALVGEVDAVFECTGVPSCVQASIYATRPGGKILLIGMGTPIQTLPISAAALREVDILGVFRYANTYPTGIDVLSKEDGGPEYPDFAKLVTHRYAGLESVEEAFGMAGRTVDGEGRLVIKVVVDVGGD